MDFTLRKYKELLACLLKKGYQFITFEQYCEQKIASSPNSLIASSPQLPIALGVIRNVEEESYDMAVNQQINEVREKSKAKTFDQLTATLEQWEI